MNKQKFVENNLDKLLEDKDIQRYCTIEDVKEIKQDIANSLDKSYDEYAKKYFESKGIDSSLSKMLRGVGTAADLVGTYTFWTFGGAGFGFKFLGLAAKSASELMDYYKFEKHQTDATRLDRVGLIGEALIEKAVAYLPLGVGEITDFVRGSAKYDAKIRQRAVGHAKKDLLEILEKPSDTNMLKIEKLVNEVKISMKDLNRRYRGIVEEPNIKYGHVTKNVTNISYTIPDYIIEHSGKFYHFNETSIGLALRLNDDKITVATPPCILSLERYEHPNVYAGGTIGYGNWNHFKFLGVKFDKGYDIKDKNTPRKITLMLMDGRHVLQQGYNNNSPPVRRIEEFHKNLIASDREGAKRYAEEKRIPFERIFKNE